MANTDLAKARQVLDRLRELLAAGKSVPTAAREIQHSRHAARRLAVKHEIPIPSRLLSAEQRALMQRLLTEGILSYREIAVRVKCDPSTVCRSAAVTVDSSETPFAPRRLRKARRCPNGHLVKLWPCVQCSAAGK